jgi:Tfp pilus assembly protein PilF
LLEAAQAKGGQGIDYWYHLGMAYHKNQQPELAREQLAKALANDKAQFFGRDEAQKVYESL